MPSQMASEQSAMSNQRNQFLWTVTFALFLMPGQSLLAQRLDATNCEIERFDHAEPDSICQR